MKELLLLRHAKSSWSNPGLADHDRPLNRRGKSDAPRMGDLLRREQLIPDLIICSTATRARKTASAVAEAAGYEGELRFTRDLYHAGDDTYLTVAAVEGDPANRVMLVGHNPGMEMLVEALSGAYERMPTAAIAYFTLDIETWSDLDEDVGATLQAVWRPKEIA
jgi:phosphohistidine phosphatase